MLYVGVKNNKRFVFPSDNEPTRKTHGNFYEWCIGPFKTEKAAQYFAGPGYLQNWCLTPNDAERLAHGITEEPEIFWEADEEKDVA